MKPTELSPIFAAFDVADPDFPPMHFQTRFQGVMLMYAASAVVGEYLQQHEDWFHRCAKPMRVEPFTEQGYLLTVGQFGSFGYEVEPKIAVVFDNPTDEIYNMYNVPIPDAPPEGYAVDYQAHMDIGDVPWQEAAHDLQKAQKCFGDRPLPEIITQINWQLHLQVMVQFPKFIYKLPQNLLRTTGDRLLAGIVSQVSPRLTAKVQQDFHSRFNLPIPPKSSSSFQVVPTPGDPDAAPESESDEKEGIDLDQIPPNSFVS